MIRHLLAATIVAPVLLGSAAAYAQTPASEKGKVCRMEQQCRRENFKKICTDVKVCR